MKTLASSPLSGTILRCVISRVAQGPWKDGALVAHECKQLIYPTLSIFLPPSQNILVISQMAPLCREHKLKPWYFDYE